MVCPYDTNAPLFQPHPPIIKGAKYYYRTFFMYHCVPYVANALYQVNGIAVMHDLYLGGAFAVGSGYYLRCSWYRSLAGTRK
jgi:hypothetical protein